MASTVKTFSTPGANTWICPPGVTSVQVELWGGGGTGGPATGTASGAGGGAGGQYAKKQVTVSPGTSYTISVAAASTAATSSVVNGNDTTFNTNVVVAKGGAGGANATGTTGTGGTGSTTGGVGDTVFAGGNGSAGVSSTHSGGGGGGAGSGGAGGNSSAGSAGTGTSTNGGNGGAGVTTANTRNNGSNYGGGGSGGLSSSSTDRAGGNGAQGLAVLTYTTPKTEMLTDNFNDNSINSALWGLLGPGTPSNQIKEQNQEIEITTDAVTSDYFTIESIEYYDLTGSYALCNLVSAGTQAANQDCIALLLEDSTFNNKLFISVNSGNMQAIQIVAGTQTTLTTLTYNSATMKWFRIRESGGTIFWDYSADGISWTNITSTATPITITALAQSMQGGQYGTAAATTYKFDYFNLPPPVGRDIQPEQNTLGAVISQSVSRAAVY